MKKTAFILLCSVFLSISVYGQTNDYINHWAKEEISWAINNNLMQGYPDGSFIPEATITRAEVIKPVTKLFNLKNTPRVFADVANGDWYYQYIMDGWDIMPPYEEKNSKTYFYPDTAITRQDAIYCLTKAKFSSLKPDTTNILNSFDDADAVADYAKEYVAIAYQLKIICGYEDNTLRPADNLTRAEFAKLLKTVYETKQIIQDSDEKEPADSTDTTNMVSSFITVLSVVNSTNDDGEEITKIIGLSSNKKIEINSTASYQNSIKPGDTVIPQMNIKNLLRSSVSLATVNNNMVTFGSDYMKKINNKTNSKFYYYYGEIENIERGKYVTLKNNSSSSDSTEFVVPFKATTYFYNTAANKNNKLYSDSIDSIEFEGDTVYMENTKYSKAYIVARECDGEVTDATVYLIE